MSPDFGLCRMSFLCRFRDFYGVFMSFLIFSNFSVQIKKILPFCIDILKNFCLRHAYFHKIQCIQSGSCTASLLS